MSSKGLGKGFAALMGDLDVSSEETPYRMLPIHKVEPNPNQPRRDFDVHCDARYHPATDGS